MLNNISRTPTFERDWKRLKRKHYDPAKLRKAIQTLLAEDADTLIHTYRNHSLKGEWAGFRELHIEGDWLLIYRIDLDFLPVLKGGDSYAVRLNEALRFGGFPLHGRLRCDRLAPVPVLRRLHGRLTTRRVPPRRECSRPHSSHGRAVCRT